jgi:uncharacterized protein YkwD
VRRLITLLALASTALAGEAPREEQLDALEARLAELLNGERTERKLAPLASHKELAAAARAHSLDMKTNHFFSHESKTTGRVNDRVTKAGIPNRGVAENLARAATAEDAHKFLMQSPKHKENILRPEFTHVGIGIVRGGDGLLLCTQAFMQAPPVYDVAKVRQEIAEGINKARLEKGLRRLIPDDVLSQQALAHSERAARSGEPQPAWLEAELRRGKDRRWRVHEAAYFVTDDLSKVIQSDAALSAQHDHFGVGVAQAPAASKEVGALWITLLCAQKK